jgi:hypothetical protein
MRLLFCPGILLSLITSVVAMALASPQQISVPSAGEISRFSCDGV